MDVHVGAADGACRASGSGPPPTWTAQRRRRTQRSEARSLQCARSAHLADLRHFLCVRQVRELRATLGAARRADGLARAGERHLARTAARRTAAP